MHKEWFHGSQEALGYCKRNLALLHATFKLSEIRVCLLKDLKAIANPIWRILSRGTCALCFDLIPWIPMQLQGRLFDLEATLSLRKAKNPPLDAALRERLIVAYHDGIPALKTLIGRILSHWQASPIF